MWTPQFQSNLTCLICRRESSASRIWTWQSMRLKVRFSAGLVLCVHAWNVHPLFVLSWLGEKDEAVDDANIGCSSQCVSVSQCKEEQLIHYTRTSWFWHQFGIRLRKFELWWHRVVECFQGRGTEPLKEGSSTVPHLVDQIHWFMRDNDARSVGR